MEKEEKFEVLKDICSRIPYKTELSCVNDVREDTCAVYACRNRWLINYNWDVDEVKPVLRSVSDMTEEERNRLFVVVADNTLGITDADERHGAVRNVARQAVAVIDYLNSIGIDYRGLIERNLATIRTISE